ncbi:TolB family protein [Intrasporangium calvum]|uniref:TolB family protein n=1 Tax=Intrasporangium calvum TaxID=53358 RepID=UPI000DF5EA15|nr:WD40 repeat domain-containing protein [Intrasporangium calvum]AXG14616.1 hypothetical protein DN585_15430 [Intrasporangium calvum]
MVRRFTVPGIDEVASRLPVDRFKPSVTFPIRRPPGVSSKLPPWFFREIAYFSYAIPTTGPVDGETTAQEDIFTVSVLTGTVRRITDDRSLAEMKSDRDPAWSPTHTSLAIHTATGGEESRIAVIDRATGAVLQNLVPGHSPEWLDDDTILYLGIVEPGTEDARADVFCVDTATVTVTRITDVGLGGSIGSISWHPSAGLAVGYTEEAGPSPRYSIAVIPAAAVGMARSTGSPVVRAGFTFVTSAETLAATPDWSPSGDRIAVSTWTDGGPGRVGILTIATSSLDLVAGPGPAEPTLRDFGPVFSRDGRLLAFTRGEEDEWSEIWLHTIASGHHRQLTDDGRSRFKGSLDW